MKGRTTVRIFSVSIQDVLDVVAKDRGSVLTCKLIQFLQAFVATVSGSDDYKSLMTSFVETLLFSVYQP